MGEASMTVPLRHRAMVMRQRRHHLARPHLPLEAAANSVQIVAIAATTTLVGATSLLQIAKCALEVSMPVPLRHRAGDTPAACNSAVFFSTSPIVYSFIVCVFGGLHELQ